MTNMCTYDINVCTFKRKFLLQSMRLERVNMLKLSKFSPNKSSNDPQIDIEVWVHLQNLGDATSFGKRNRILFSEQNGNSHL